MLFSADSFISVTSELGKTADGSRGIPGGLLLGKHYACDSVSTFRYCINFHLAELEGLEVGQHLLLGLGLLVCESYDHISRMYCCHWMY